MGYYALIALLSLLIANRGHATEPSRDSVLAAVRVFGRITGVERKIAVCREIDPTSTETYDRAFMSYQVSIEPVMARIYILLKTEAKRFGLPQEQFIRQATGATDIAEQEVKRLQAVNPGAFLQQCRNITKSADHIEQTFGSLREQWPDDVRLLDGWR